MGSAKRLASSLLLASGIVLVLMGLSTALGFTAVGMVTSVTVIAALLYAGGLWLGGTPRVAAPAGAEKVLVFDRGLRIAAGAAPGASLLTQFPESMRAEIETHCRAALRGQHSHFTCEHAGKRVLFDVAPIQSVAGLVLYGVLITGSGNAVAALTPAVA
ncbi:MAG: hypothetical protein A3H96_09245 [Acidobacteria bacterium RIFCSPLOWO2_02_FULL_67_36]|nr:MAG: hypothetical protein A3H96_09245 [Acidobacteria bacterium RIFCSPLOWO2_02_FULL_67_36]OFW25041.1 MAG: hypothetical protein A3G21_16490 [Acidobacteria bacterium RIFCSPLOWO2_12_FULL_66_21]